jgi:putative ABC transport system substrate-binding protein
MRYVTASSVDEFDQVFVKLGWIEGRNLTIEYRWAEGRSDRAGELAAELVGLKPDVIVTYANGSTGTCLRARAVLAHAARVPPGTGSA